MLPPRAVNTDFLDLKMTRGPGLELRAFDLKHLAKAGDHSVVRSIHASCLGKVDPQILRAQTQRHHLQRERKFACKVQRIPFSL